eukprot:CAMPEP_0113939954 /NCGR_PEP_ID=MMETSP1339-20121228/6160_1 /TAXON_ID=94617 /ORGANISM="Fibrocapsa japonica" /LENGTH=293 /DNA_ID=CAMNT_0000943605 /DNA_START=228 /DNA_END=1109 /DNA_ORIENTATION=- /assembly_acc=CAM_ASM_000762
MQAEEHGHSPQVQVPPSKMQEQSVKNRTPAEFQPDFWASNWKTFAPSLLLIGTALLSLPSSSLAAPIDVAGLGPLANSFKDSMVGSAFLQAFSLVFVSELGDKTFFIAGLLAMKTSRAISFIGSIGALTAMTVMCVIIGQVFHTIPSGVFGTAPVDTYIAVAAFLYFGVKTLKDAYELPAGDKSGIEEELEDAQESVKEIAGDKNAWGLILQTFSLVFAAEIGDRSFLTTIALGAANNPLGVAAGGISAHASATGIAVASGAFLSKYLSEKVIGYIGGVLFIIFAITTALGVF